jgi:lysophospholipase L1-like esterase
VFARAAVAVSLLALLVLAFAGEGLTRLAYHFGSRRFIHPFLGETQKPLHQRTDITPEGEAFTYSTNNYGFRGGIIPDRKPRGVKYIFVLGGSTTASNEYPHEDTWPGLLERQLRAGRGGGDIRVFNAGMGSATSYHSLMIFLNHVTRLEPDLVIVYEGINDKPPFYPSSARYFRDIGQGEDFLHRPSYLLYELALHTRSQFLTRLARSRLPQAQPAQDFSYHEKNYRDIAQPIMPGVTDARGLPETNDGVNESTRRLGRGLGVPVFDFAAIMPLDAEHFLPDGVHYTKVGNARIADELASWLAVQGLP